MGRVRKNKHSLHRTVGAVQRGGKFARESIFLLKINSKPSELFSGFRKVIKSRSNLRAVHGNPFPLSYEEMFTPPTGFPSGVVKEAIWAICRASVYSDELKEYLATRTKFESKILIGEYEGAAALLRSHQEKMGVSLWLAQAWMTLGDDAPEAYKNASQHEFDAAPPSSVAAFMLRYLARRTESRGSKNFLKEEISAKVDHLSDVFGVYAGSRIFDINNASPSELSAVMFYEAQGSLIDHYEALIVTLQDMASVVKLPGEIAEVLDRPVLTLLSSIGDRRLVPVALAFGCIIREDVAPISIERSLSFEAYFRGDYKESVLLATQYLVETDPTDAASLALLARSIVRSGCGIPSLPSPIAVVCKSLVEVMLLNEVAYGEATAIFSVADSHYGHTWALYLRKVVTQCLQQESAVPIMSQMRELAVLDPYISPITQACTRSQSLAYVQKRLLEGGGYPITASAVGLLYFGAEPSKDAPPVTRRRALAYQGRNRLESGNGVGALDCLSALKEEVVPQGRYRVLTSLAIANAKMGNSEAALAFLIDAHLEKPEVPTSLPLDVVVNTLGEAVGWPSTIDVPIALELYNAYSSDGRLAELRFAFERYQDIHDIQSAADLTEKLGIDGRPRAILYLDRVWTPEVMRQTLHYNGSEEIGEARIAVCRQLAVVDSKNSTFYLDEIRERVKQDEISKGTTLIEQSKVYVDIAAIKRNIKAKVGGQYSRYKASSSNRDGASQVVVDRIADAVFDLQATENASLSKLLSNLHLVDDVETETDSQFDPIFTEVTYEFLRGDHGLNAYLSTRVRHGVLANTLRKPLADEHLTTIKDEASGVYKGNSYWEERFEAQDPLVQDIVARSLERFASSFDNVVQELRDSYLQIAISHGVNDMRQDGKAAFVYRSSNLERRFMQRYAIQSRTMDEFIDVCIENLWEKTDGNLVSVRRDINEVYRPRFAVLFDRLANDIAACPYGSAIADLRNCIYRAKTQLRLRLDEVSSWFKRSQVYDRQDYDPRLPIDIALNMISKTASESSATPEVEIMEYDRSVRMPGRTLDGMVDAFYVILSNAIEHSGLDGNDLKISIKFDLKSTRYLARVESSLASCVPTLDQEASVESIREGLNRSDSRRLAQMEGGSGLRKLWRSINSPFYDSPILDFGFLDNEKFYVEISYDLEVHDEASNC